MTDRLKKFLGFFFIGWGLTWLILLIINLPDKGMPLPLTSLLVMFGFGGVVFFTVILLSLLIIPTILSIGDVINWLTHKEG